MKKLFVILATLAAVMSCTKEAFVETNPVKADAELVPMSFTVSCETKAVLNEDLSVSFVPGDRISVFANGTNYEFTTEAGGASAIFSGLAPEADTYYALYPYMEDATIEDGVIKNAKIGSGSAGTGTGSFNSQRAVAVAVTTDKSLNFKHVTALLKLTVPAEVEDLKEVIFFNRENGSGNLAGALTGTFDITPSASGEPVVNVTEPAFQTGLVGPYGSEDAIPAGDYYIPVLPAQLTAKKGIDIKMTFMDNFVGRAFNGHGIKLERAKVYNLGIVKKTDSFIYDSFESGAAISGDDYTGNTNALVVIENPVKTDANNSAYVLKNDMSASTSGTSGYIQVKTAGTNGYTMFPNAVRPNYNRVRILMYLGTNEYYPRARRGSNPAARPAFLNGVAIDDNKETWEAAVKKNDWNVMEWNATQIDAGWTHFQNLQTLEFRPFVKWDGSNVSGFDEVTNNRLIYVDDISFVLK